MPGISKVPLKSRSGAAVAAAYLLLVFALLMVTAFGGGGLHSGTAMAALFVVILTFPLSWVGLWTLDLLNPPPTYEQGIFLAILAACAIINAGVIYLVVGFVSRAIQAVVKKVADRWRVDAV